MGLSLNGPDMRELTEQVAYLWGDYDRTGRALVEVLLDVADINKLRAILLSRARDIESEDPEGAAKVRRLAGKLH